MNHLDIWYDVLGNRPLQGVTVINREAVMYSSPKWVSDPESLSV